MPVVNFNVFGNKDGNVGIGNNAPTNKLHVTGTSLLSANATLGAALIANGSAGSAGQVLHSNGTATYWAADDDVNTTYDLLTVANDAVNQARVRLSASTLANDDVLIIGANGITTFSNSTAAYALAVGSSTITVNTTGIHVNPVLSITDLTVTGNLSVLGDTVTLNVASVSIEDSLVEYARNQDDTATFTDALDIGFYGSYGNTANSWSSGLFRDQSDSGVWKIFQSNGVVTNTNINTTNSSLYSLAPLRASSFGTTEAGYGSSTGGAIANATNVAVGNSTVNTAVGFGTIAINNTAMTANSTVLYHSGSIGVGITSPSSRVHTYDNVNSAAEALRFQNANAGSGAHSIVRFYNDVSQAGFYFNSSTRSTDVGVNGFGFYNDATGGNLQFRTPADIFFQTGSPATERMRIDNVGNVRIGGNSTSSAPTLNRGVYLQSSANNDVIGYSIHIEDGTNNRRGSMFLDDAAGLWGWDVTASSGVPGYVWRTANTERMRITSGGNVGIANLNPTNTLSVNGTSYFSGNVSFRSNLLLSDNFVKKVITAASIEATDTTYELCRISRDSVNWSTQFIEITVYNRYYRGGKTSWTITYNQANNGTVVCTESSGTLMHKVYLGAEVIVSGTIGYRPVLIDIPAYQGVEIEISHGYLEVTSTPSAASRIQFTGTSVANASAVNYGGDVHIVPAGGNVGIGTLTPSGKLHIASSAASQVFRTDESTSGYTYTQGVDNTGIYYSHDSSARGYRWISNSQERMRLAANGNFGIRNSSPPTVLTVNAKVIDDAGVTYDANTVYITHQSPTATATLNDPKPVLLLARQGTGGQAFGAAAEFSLSRYENNSVNSRTRLDIRLAHASFMDTANTTVMTMRSDGNVGIGATAPYARLNILKASTYSNEDESGIAISSSTSSNTASLLLGADNTNSISYIQGVRRGASWIQNISLNPMGGFVGVGTIAPNTTLHVQGTALFRNSGATITLDSGSATDARMEFKYNNVRTGMIGIDNAVFSVTANSSASLTLGSNNMERMRLAANGNIGIGNTAPTVKLQVSGAAQLESPTLGNPNGGALFLTNTDPLYGWLFGVHSNGNVWAQAQRVDANSTAYNMTLQPSGGNVGIGTTNPDSKFHAVASSASLRVGYNNTSENYYDANSHQFRSGAGATRMLINSAGNVGINKTPAGWDGGTRALQLNVYTSLVDSSAGFTWLTNNSYYDGTNWKYLTTNRALRYEQNTADGGHKWFNAVAGTAEANISFVQAMTLNGDGNVGIGTIAPAFTNGSGLEIERAGVATLRLQNTNFNASEIRQTGSLFELTSLGSQPVILGTNNQERVRITDSTVGVGSATVDSGQNITLTGINTALSTAPYFTLNNRGLPGTNGTVYPIGGMLFASYRDVRSPAYIGGITMEAVNNSGITSYAKSMIFRVGNIDGTNGGRNFSNDSDSAIPSERMRIDGDGNVGIGNTNPSSRLVVQKAAGLSTAGELHLTDGTYYTMMNTRQNPGTYNPLVQSADHTIIFSDGTIETGSFVIAQHSASSKGMRIAANGNIGIATAAPGYTLQVNGSFAATTKSFVIDHPTKPNHKLRYGSLESPYHGIRLTGEAEVVDGVCTVKLPEYIHALCHSEGVNIQLTNIKHGKVLWVDEINIDNNEFTVATETNGNYKFYWSFTAIRKDIEDMVVEFEENEKE